MKLATIVPAIGDGRRQHIEQRKARHLLGGKPILAHTLERLEQCSRIHDIYPIVPTKDRGWVETEIVAQSGLRKVVEVLGGGLLRQDFVHRALERIGTGYDLVMIHDGNRPLVSQSLLARTIAAAEVHGAALAAVPAHDTIKAVTKDSFVASSYDRRRLRSIQTPQVFRHDILTRALAQAVSENYYGSDEASLVERLGEKIKVVAGSRLNIYVATPEDLRLACALLQMEKDMEQ